ncbi:protein phosphatase 2C domain-containing protein [Naumannella halotolerans]|uniref:Serine/threonine protein phosphatase PrpC n=1 Tax=Naumannella halotolerans TaxID=993414 RepID=A0A4R7JBB4_9ACTN|nr:protein phosphatase 2C domain-containing protein [Naumannella halotolerans]TDT33719.1 serine/threonine protein phosphatase PrpC [Naumannella halotolerans]
MSEPTSASRLQCPSCGAEVQPYESFCEACGGELDPTAEPPGEFVDDVPVHLSRSVRAQSPDLGFDQQRRPCAECGATVSVDGYCEVCGTKATLPRDHFSESPAGWLAGTSDLGLRHQRNEDAMALAAEEPPGSLGVLVVCDGVSTAPDSDVASLAAARAARDLLVSTRPSGLGTAASANAAAVQTMVDAAATANAAVVGSSTVPVDAAHAPSCTFVAATVHDGLITWGSLGDSRIYWIADSGASALITTDDSVAQARIAMGVDRATAENGPGAHAITKWLGADAPDLSPQTGQFAAPGPGWLLVCSDGLWNYASSPEELERVFAEAVLADPPTNHNPLALSRLLVAWARDQGGRDNITVALARFGNAQWQGPVRTTGQAEPSPLESDSPTRSNRPPHPPVDNVPPPAPAVPRTAPEPVPARALPTEETS